jgi:transposase-like protein
MTKATRGRYTLEFKQEAARPVESGQSTAAAARSLGVVDQTLGNWVKAHRAGTLKGSSGKPEVSAMQMENSRLRAELARVTMERRHLGKSDVVLRKGPEVKYVFIQRNKRVWPIRVQCRVLLVSASGYHEHLARYKNIARRRHLSDEALLVHIRAVYAENRGVAQMSKKRSQTFCLDLITLLRKEMAQQSQLIAPLGLKTTDPGLVQAAAA